MRATLFAVPASHPSLAAQLMLEHKGIDYRRVDSSRRCTAPPCGRSASGA
jgi:hypothetical protein